MTLANGACTIIHFFITKTLVSRADVFVAASHFNPSLVFANKTKDGAISQTPL
jgi:hypothetical protein